MNRVKKLSRHPVRERAGHSRAASTSDRRWLGLVAICGATFMLLVDVTIVQVALPTIQRQFHSSLTNLQWIISAYALTLSALILTCGSLADVIGRKRIFIAGIALFTASSLLCGLATGSLFLNVARAAQGVGGAAMFATSLALIGQDFQGPERAKAIGIWGATVGAAVAVGPLVGGAITSGIGWRWIFFVNLPIGVVTISMAARLLVNKGDPRTRSIDIPGLVTFSGALFLLNYALLTGTDKGWTSTLILASFVGAVVLLAAFITVETRREHPMFDLSLFRNPGFCGVSIATFGIGMGMFALFPFLTLYLQNDLGNSPFGGGIRMLPATLLTFAVPLATRKATQSIPPRYVLSTGLLITAAGIATMLIVTSQSGWTALLAGLLLTGLGIGLANPSIAHIGLGVVDPARTGMASGISNTMRISGLATGIAALGAAFQARISSEVQTLLPGAPKYLAGTIASGGKPAAIALFAHHPPLKPPVSLVASQSFVSGFHAICLIGAIAVGIGAVGSFVLIRSHHFFALRHGAPAAGAAASSEPVPVAIPAE